MQILGLMLATGRLHAPSQQPAAVHAAGHLLWHHHPLLGRARSSSSSSSSSSSAAVQDAVYADVDDDSMLTAAACRLKLLRSPTRDMAMRLKGVTFDNKQQLIQQLLPGQGVVFSKEPSNPADPHAVAVYTAGMQQLGYIPRHAAQHWPLQTCFGRVLSVGTGGYDGAAPWGATVGVKPLLHGLCMDLLPDAWQQQAEQGLQQDGSAWQALQEHVAVQQYGSRCAVTGKQQQQASTHLVPQWCFDYLKKQVQLAQLIPLCEPLYCLTQDLAAAAGQLAHLAPALQLPHAPATGEDAAGGNGHEASQPPAGQAQQQQQPAQVVVPPTNSEVEALHAAHAAAAAAAVAELSAQQQEAVRWLGVFMQWQAVDVVRYLAYAGWRQQRLLQDGWQLVVQSAAGVLSELQAARTSQGAAAAAVNAPS